ncbi:uncharacterized protein LOC116431982 [Nomia melanderi]|uniref:uncharacterized protein LOC116431982 n=1 Tax=Nomia melanderi TaxID=2448451 RepID=UPI00130454F9|nr:uncharacterized protein LOC116431982 [Nomia melanderi]XP_031844182.1 uncharacterized protein LOC116431982 [Nomia melanderi]
MDANHFEKLIFQARQLDVNLENLAETWKRPDVSIGRFGDRSEETDVEIAALWKKIEFIQEGIIQTKLKIDKHVEDVSIERVFEKTKTEYESLKEQCDNIELIFEKYGYHYNEENNLDQNTANSTEMSDLESSKEITEISEVEFTPNLSWKEKVTYKKHINSIFNESGIPHLVTTPITKNSTSILKDTSIIQNDLLYTPIKHTPVRERPPEPIYSRHFYNSLKQ